MKTNTRKPKSTLIGGKYVLRKLFLQASGFLCFVIIIFPSSAYYLLFSRFSAAVLLRFAIVSDSVVNQIRVYLLQLLIVHSLQFSFS